MENPHNKGKSLIIILFNIFAVFSIITSDGFPYLGFCLASIIFASLILFFKNTKIFFDYTLFLSIILLSLFLILRSNELLTFFNVTLLIYLNSIFTWPKEEKERLTFLKVLIAPLYTFIKAVQTTNTFKLSVKNPFKGKVLSDKKFNKYVISTWITIFVLFIIIPLLSSANPLFKDYIENIFSIIKLEGLWDVIFTKNWFPVLVTRIIIFTILTAWIPYILSYSTSEKSSSDDGFQQINFSKYLQLPKVVVITILILFFIAQLQVYFPTNPNLKDLSDNINEIFGQLSVVALIIFILIYNDNNKTFSRKLTTIILILEGLFLTLMAFKSDLDYTSTTGFTLQRLYGFAVIFWISGLFLLYVTKLTFKFKIALYIKTVIVLSILTFLIINVSNFDHIIYHQEKFENPEDLEHEFLSKLSTDAQSFHLQLPILQNEIQEYCLNDEDSLPYELEDAIVNLNNNLYALETKYRNISWQTFNLSEYKEFMRLEIENIKYKDISRECEVIIAD